MIKSGDAYMLIYIRRDSRAAASTTTPEIPPLARKAVDELDADLQRRIETFNETCVLAVDLGQANLAHRTHSDAKLSKRFEDDRAKKEALWRLLDTAEADVRSLGLSSSVAADIESMHRSNASSLARNNSKLGSPMVSLRPCLPKH